MSKHRAHSSTIPRSVFSKSPYAAGASQQSVVSSRSNSSVLLVRHRMEKAKEPCRRDLASRPLPLHGEAVSRPLATGRPRKHGPYEEVRATGKVVGVKDPIDTTA